jgi:hypothetical protein
MTCTGEGIVLRGARPHGGRWLLAFDSPHELWHQLYVNGVLHSRSRTIAQRQFDLPASLEPVVLSVLAVSEDLRDADCSWALGAPPPWLVRVDVVQGPPIVPGTRVALVELLPAGAVRLCERELWPAHQPRWAFGQDPMGAGAWGLDGAMAPGFGMGALGAFFGADAYLVPLRAVLGPGPHTLAVRTTAPYGSHADSPPWRHDAPAPPAPPSALRASRYDPQSNTLTLEIQP